MIEISGLEVYPLTGSQVDVTSSRSAVVVAIEWCRKQGIADQPLISASGSVFRTMPRHRAGLADPADPADPACEFSKRKLPITDTFLCAN